MWLCHISASNSSDAFCYILTKKQTLYCGFQEMFVLKLYFSTQAALQNLKNNHALAPPPDILISGPIVFLKHPWWFASLSCGPSLHSSVYSPPWPLPSSVHKAASFPKFRFQFKCHHLWEVVFYPSTPFVSFITCTMVYVVGLFSCFSHISSLLGWKLPEVKAPSL